MTLPAQPPGPGPADALVVRPAADDDREWIRATLVARWGSVTIISRGRAHAGDRLPALIAERASERIGLATYDQRGDQAELVSLDALIARAGIGTALLQAVVGTVTAAGCRRLWLITSNDNIDALRFYQRRGFRITAVHAGAIDRSREAKPAIPLTGAYGIPVHDEIELSTGLPPAAGSPDAR